MGFEQILEAVPRRRLGIRMDGHPGLTSGPVDPVS